MFLFVSLLLMEIILTYVITKIAWLNIDRVEKKSRKQQQTKQSEERNENE